MLWTASESPKRCRGGRSPRRLQEKGIRLLAFLLLAGWAVLGPRASAADYFVAPDGNDGWSGRLPTPSANGTDGPFASLLRARDAIREQKSKRPFAEPVKIQVRGGVYQLAKAIEFGPEDSGTESAPIFYMAFPGEHPVFSGGRAITGWRKTDGGLFQVELADVREGRWKFHQLFVDGQRRSRARTPNEGYLYTEGTLAPFDRAKWYAPEILAKQGFRFRAGDITSWENFQDALIVIYHSWTTSTHYITALDPQERTVRLAPHSTWPIGYWWEYNTRYHVENIREALDEPGEWYLARASGTLTYMPLPGEDPEKAQIVAPVVPQTLLAFRGRPEENRFVEHLSFQGLSFQHTDCVIEPDMPLDQQGATERKALVWAEGLRHTLIEDCEIAHAGENGAWLGRGCSHVTMRRSHIHDLGGGGVYVGPAPGQAEAGAGVEHMVLHNNWIHNGSRIFRGSQGIWIGRASYNEVTHNEVSDFHHIGISVGHSWGYAPSSANHNVIALNHIHHICNGYFSDGGGIYTLGISPGTVIRGNLVHDVMPTPLMPVGGTGIYLDEGSSEILVENNIVYDVGAGAFHQHYGKENLVRNNVFALGGRDLITCARPEEHLSYTFEGNIVLSDGGQATSDHYSPLSCKTEFRRNLYWDTSGKEPLFSGATFAAWRETGRDPDSKIADPLFQDVARRDFRLKASSPALAMGFRQIPVEEIGLYGDPEWVAGPSRLVRIPAPDLPPPPPPPPPRPLLEDFESTEMGKLPGTLAYSPPDRPDALGVVAGPEGGGVRSLAFTKLAGLQYGFQPHAFFSSDRYTSGQIRFEFDFFNHPEHPSELYVALRDYSVKGREYADGPSLSFKPDGSVTAASNPLAKLPLGRWIHVVIECPSELERTSPGTYRLALGERGAEPLVHEGLPFADPSFSRFSWFGFASVGALGSTCYVDNLRLELTEKSR